MYILYYTPSNYCSHFFLQYAHIQSFTVNLHIFSHFQLSFFTFFAFIPQFRLFFYAFLTYYLMNFVYFLTHFRLFHEDFPCFFRQFARICSFSGFIFQNIALFCFKTTENICCYESNKTNVPLSQTIITYFYAKISKQ